jgi:hypothetical protein
MEHSGGLGSCPPIRCWRSDPQAAAAIDILSEDGTIQATTSGIEVGQVCIRAGAAALCRARFAVRAQDCLPLHFGIACSPQGLITKVAQTIAFKLGVPLDMIVVTDTRHVPLLSGIVFSSLLIGSGKPKNAPG